MKNCIEDYGKIAGRIWRTLDRYGPIDEKVLVRKIRLNKNDFYAGIGWLARENKISKDGSYFKLSETNLTEKIGGDAGKIWDTLNNSRDINVSSISKISQLKIEDACTALGWLAREDKLRVNLVNKEPRYNLK